MTQWEYCSLSKKNRIAGRTDGTFPSSGEPSQSTQQSFRRIDYRYRCSGTNYTLCIWSLEKIIGWDNQDFVENGWALGISLTHPEDVKTTDWKFPLWHESLEHTAIYTWPSTHHLRIQMATQKWIRRWVKSETYVLERDANDRVLYTIIFSTDITEEKKQRTSSDRQKSWSAPPTKSYCSFQYCRR